MFNTHRTGVHLNTVKMTRDTPSGRAPRARPKTADCKRTAEKFFTYLNDRCDKDKVTDKDQLRDIFYGDFKSSLRDGEKLGRSVY